MADLFYQVSVAAFAMSMPEAELGVTHGDDCSRTLSFGY